MNDTEESAMKGHDGEPSHTQWGTIGEFLRAMWNHRGASIMVFLATLGLALGVAAIEEPRYEAEATVVPTHEEKTLVAALDSSAYASRVAQRIGVVDDLGDGNATLAGRELREHVEFQSGDPVGGLEPNAIHVRASWNSPQGAASVANGYIDELPASRDIIEKVVHDRLWKKYYDHSGGNASKAEERLQGLLAGYHFFHVLDRAETPEEPVYPDWSLRVTIGAMLGATLATLTPYFAESVTNLRDRFRRRRR